MAEPSAYSDTDVSHDPDSPPSRPRWVKVSAIVAVILVVLVGIMLLAGHGPGRHFGGDHNPGRHTPPVGGHSP